MATTISRRGRTWTKPMESLVGGRIEAVSPFVVSGRLCEMEGVKARIQECAASESCASSLMHACLRLIALGVVAWTASASDWPQFLGPNRDGTSPETLSPHATTTEPHVLWSRDVGAGFSGPVVVGDRLVLHQRRGAEEILECLDARKGGSPLWKHEYPTEYRDDFGFDEGPRATPTVTAGRVYAFGAEGTLSCVDMREGKVLWSVPTAKSFRANKGFFGFACSPLVHNGVVMVNVGGANGAGIVGFDAETGAVRWKASNQAASYSSPILATISGEARAVFFTRQGLVVLDPQSGAVRAEFPWRSRMEASVNAAAPLMQGDRVFLTASYGTGAVLLDLHGGQPVTVWSGDESLSSHYASVVARQGYVYGFHGRQEYGASLRCIEAATGAVKWSFDGLGCGSVTMVGDTLMVLTEGGELVFAPATPDGFRPLGRFQVLGTGTRSFPAFSDGRLYARDTKRLVCLEPGGNK